MLLESLRRQVLEANQEIARRGLAPHTFGNASGIDRTGSQPLVVIKPSGVDYATLAAEDLVDYRPRRQDCRGSPSPLQRSRHPHPALSRISADRRHRPHPLRIRYRLGPILPADSLPGNHPCRLLPRPRSRYGTAHRRRSFLRLRPQHRRCHRPPLSFRGSRPGSRSLVFWSQATHPSRGERRQPKLSNTPTSSNTSPGSPSARPS